MKLTKRALLGAVFAASLATPFAGASAKDLTILTSVPGLNFPFFVHMLNAMKDEVKKQGAAAQEADGQNAAPKQTADVATVAVELGYQKPYVRPEGVAIVTYDFVREKGRWVIDDIRTPRWSVRDLLSRWLKDG